MDFQAFQQVHGCAHPSREVRKKPYQREGKTYYRVRAQCLTCGESTPAGPVSPDLHARLPLYDEALGAAWQKAFYAAWHAHIATERTEQDRAWWWTWYNAYLQTPAWQQRRQAVLRRAQGVCEGCGASRAVQVHHLTYDHVGEEFLFELVAICESCHERLHSYKTAQSA